MRHLLLAASLALIATPAFAQRADLDTSVRGGSQNPSVIIPDTTAAPVPSRMPPLPGDGAPSAIPEVVSPAGGDAPSGPAKATPYSAGPSSSDTVPTVGATPGSSGYGGVVPGNDETTSR